MHARTLAGKFDWSEAFVYVVLTNSISQGVAMYCLLLYYHGTPGVLTGYSRGTKLGPHERHPKALKGLSNCH